MKVDTPFPQPYDFWVPGNSKMLTRAYRRFAVLAVAAAMLAASSTPQADPNRYVADIKALASPEMEGRGAGTPDDVAARVRNDADRLALSSPDPQAGDRVAQRRRWRELEVDVRFVQDRHRELWLDRCTSRANEEAA